MQKIRRRRRLISLRHILIPALLAFSVVCLSGVPGDAGPAVRDEDGKFFDKEDLPTYSIKEDGTVDWYTYSGFRRYHSDCHVCHGPDGAGSSYAPSLVDSVKRMAYQDFMTVVASGRKNVNASHQSVMPAFGDNRSVMCYLDDIYVYLKARADDAVPRGRPSKRADKPQSAKTYEEQCL
jgi:methanol metabolism-related c-type cytochrome